MTNQPWPKWATSPFKSETYFSRWYRINVRVEWTLTFLWWRESCIFKGKWWHNYRLFLFYGGKISVWQKCFHINDLWIRYRCLIVMVHYFNTKHSWRTLHFYKNKNLTGQVILVRNQSNIHLLVISFLSFHSLLLTLSLCQAKVSMESGTRRSLSDR